MKKLLSIILALCMIFAMVGCAPVETKPESENKTSISDRFRIIETEIHSAEIYQYAVDTETNVTYLIIKWDRGVGVTSLVDETGAPLLWEAD